MYHHDRRSYNEAASAAEQEVGAKDVTRILKAHLGKGDAEAVQALFDGPDVQNLPAGKTAYRLSNAVSFFAQTDGLSRTKKLELEEVAGQLLPAFSGGKAREV